MNVHSNLLDPFVRGRRRSAPVCLLLLTIVYGAIVEAAHSHGFVSSRAQATAVSGNNNQPSSYRGQSSGNDCSLCQFQRQLFGGFVHAVLTVHTPQQIAFVSETTVSYLSASALPPSGRAPPRI